MTHARTTLLLAAVLGSAALAAGCASDMGEDGVMLSSPVQQGRALAQAECSSCHAVRELGDSPRPEAPPLREVLDRYNATRLRQAFREGMVVGHVDMPVYALSEADVDALLAYLQDIKE